MTSVKRRKVNRCCSSRICIRFIIGLNLFVFVFILKYHLPTKCFAKDPSYEIVDRQDEWQYQNTITGEWFHWRTVYKKENNIVEWRVNWLNTVPTSYLGVIVYLARRNDRDTLEISLRQLSHLLVNNSRPIVIFHEGDLGDNDTQQSLAKILDSRTPLGFERIHFSNMSNQPRSIYRKISRSYFDMCRFFTLMLPTHPLLSLFSFYWRLDTHSYIFASKPIKDPFEIMQKRQIQYAFVIADEEGDPYVVGLWSLFHEFLNYYCLKPSEAVRQTQTGWFRTYTQSIFYTNFAIANVSLFRDHSLMQAWLHKVDQNGGIYRYRWGDAPIHTLALTQLVERNHIAQLRYFGYVHRREYICASGIQRNLCQNQAQPWLTDPKITYVNYYDGCVPPSRNPLCYYYPQIRL